MIFGHQSAATSPIADTVRQSCLKVLSAALGAPRLAAEIEEAIASASVGEAAARYRSKVRSRISNLVSFAPMQSLRVPQSICSRIALLVLLLCLFGRVVMHVTAANDDALRPAVNRTEG